MSKGQICSVGVVNILLSQMNGSKIKNVIDTYLQNFLSKNSFVKTQMTYFKMQMNFNGN